MNTVAKLKILFFRVLIIHHGNFLRLFSFLIFWNYINKGINYMWSSVITGEQNKKLHKGTIYHWIPLFIVFYFQRMHYEFQYR